MGCHFLLQGTHLELHEILISVFKLDKMALKKGGRGFANPEVCTPQEKFFNDIYLCLQIDLTKDNHFVRF